MQDVFGRNIDYLRISVTPACNYSCIYCKGWDERNANSCGKMTLDEISEVVEAFVRCGIKKIRLTGGEPLMRSDIVSICRNLSSIEGLAELTMTTNGSLLSKMVYELKQAGVKRLNISVDSLKPERFERLTGGKLSDVYSGIEMAHLAGFKDTKINVVLLGGINDDEIEDFVNITRELPLTVRFIELMPIGECANWKQESFVSSDEVLRRVPELERIGTDGVAEIYRIPGAKGSVGLISAISHKFCVNCNRLRLTADGALKTCLHSDEEYSIKGLHGAELDEAIKAAIMHKPVSHSLDKTHASKAHRRMFEIGG